MTSTDVQSKDWRDRGLTNAERPLAKGLKLISLLNRLASIFRAEDLAERGGRASWRPPEVVLSERPYLRAQILRQTKGGAHE